MLTGHQLGEDAARDPGRMHRMAWLRKERHARPAAEKHTAEQALRERTA